MDIHPRGEGSIAMDATHPEEIEAFKALARYDSNQFHFAQERDFRRRQSGRQRQRHDCYVLMLQQLHDIMTKEGQSRNLNCCRDAVRVYSRKLSLRSSYFRSSLSIMTGL